MAKAEQKHPTPAFNPVVLTLETQDEVDAIYAAMNTLSATFGIRNITGCDVSADIREALQSFMTGQAETIRLSILRA